MASHVQDTNAVSEYDFQVLVGVGITLTVLPIITVGMRFFVRFRTRTDFGPDDWMILAAMVRASAAAACCILLLYYNF